MKFFRGTFKRKATGWSALSGSRTKTENVFTFSSSNCAHCQGIDL